MRRPLFAIGLSVLCAAGTLGASRAAVAQVEMPELLRSPRNVAEIGLTDSQKKQIVELRRQLSDRRQQMNRAVAELQRDTQDRIMAVLTARQRERLSQFYYQNRGPLALQEPLTARALGLTDEQTRQLQAIRLEARKANPRTRADFEKIVKARDAKFLAVLTPGQRALWDKMQGPPRKRELSLTSRQQRQIRDYLRKVSPLTNSRNAEELKLTDHQRETIRQLTQSLWNGSELKSIQQQFGERYDRADSEQHKTKIQQEMADAVRKLFDREIEKIESVLTRQQREQLARLRNRLSQARYRSRGTGALTSADITEQLGLTDAQKEKMKLLQQTAQQAELKEQRESRERLRRIKEERDDKYLDVLTPAQRAQWEKMIGQPLKRLKRDI